jgi:hypothetical protein
VVPPCEAAPDGARERVRALPRERAFVACVTEPRRDEVALVPDVAPPEPLDTPPDPPVPLASPAEPVPELPVVDCPVPVLDPEEPPLVWAMAPVVRPRAATATVIIAKRIVGPFGW